LGVVRNGLYVSFGHRAAEFKFLRPSNPAVLYSWYKALSLLSTTRLTSALELIFSVFKTLTDQTVTVELKNDLSITGVLKSVDQSVPIHYISIGKLRTINIILDF
jgi:hypothetical protein